MTAWLIDSAIRSWALAGLAGLVLLALRVRRAEVHLRVWTIVAATSLVMPAVSPWLPAISVPGLSSAIGDITTMAPIPGAAFLTATTTPTAPAATPAIPWLALVYLIGVAILLLRGAVGWRLTMALRRSATPVEGAGFAVSPRVRVPVTAGVLRPAIILPPDWRSWSEDTLRAVLAHERAHHARRDGLAIVIACIFRIVHWPNPLSWWLARHVATLAERASDDAALRHGVPAATYADTLLRFAAEVGGDGRRVAWHLPMARGSSRRIEQRLTHVFSWKGSPPMTRTRQRVLAAGIIVCAMAAYTVTSAVEPVPGTDRQAGASPARERVHPVLLKKVDPAYTPEAKRARIRGVVELEVVIGVTGDVTSAKVAKSLDTVYGLDRQAMTAVTQWKFRPATVDGVAEASTAIVQMEFTLPKETQTQAPPVFVAPVLIKSVQPRYTADAMRARIQGTVKVQLVVDARGLVAEAKVIESLDDVYGLDANAIAAVMDWRYQPATHDGAPVPATVVVELQFRVHDD